MKGRDSEGKREGTTLYVKEPGLFTTQNSPPDPPAIWWILKGTTCMHSCRHSSCHAKELRPRTAQNSALCFSAFLMTGVKLGPLSIYLSVAYLQHLAFRNTKLTLLLSELYVDLLTDITTWKDIKMSKAYIKPGSYKKFSFQVFASYKLAFTEYLIEGKKKKKLDSLFKFSKL